MIAEQIELTFPEDSPSGSLPAVVGERYRVRHTSSSLSVLVLVDNLSALTVNLIGKVTDDLIQGFDPQTVQYSH